MKKNVKTLSDEEKLQLNEALNALNKIANSSSLESYTKNIYLYNALSHLNTINLSQDILQNSLLKKSFDYIDIKDKLISLPYLEEAEKNLTKLEKDINEKEVKHKQLIDQLKTEKFEKHELSVKLREIEESEHELRKRQELVFLTSRVHPEAANILLVEGNGLLTHFTDQDSKEMAIMSIDIRRSTELMLKASSHADYALFITGLCEQLKAIVIRNYGVFDKFTGDGILAYFPVFYTGEAAIFNCLAAAKECHDLFANYYEDNRKRFSVVIKTGLGIGVDYGNAKLVKINDEQTVVGTPVVYACRLSSAPYNHTFINQTAFDKVNTLGITLNVKETEIDLKNEGIAIVYDLVSIKDQKVFKPEWK